MSSKSDRTFVFDSGPLSHFTEAGWLGLLELYVGDGLSWLPDTVVHEINNGMDQHPHLRQVLSAPWLNIQTVSAIEVPAFNFYYGRLVETPPTNSGECGVLALAEVHGGVAVIDDSKARKLAEERKVETVTTISIICDLVRDQLLGFDAADKVADNLLRTEYHLPFEIGGFKTFVTENGLLDPYA